MLSAASAEPAAIDPAAARRGISASDTADTAKDTASIPKAAVDAPVMATSAPPIAGPISDPAWTAVEDSALPAASRASSSSDGMIVYEAGRNSPSPAADERGGGAERDE